MNLSQEIPGMAGRSNGSRSFGGNVRSSGDIAKVPAVELLPSTALELMTAAAVHLGLAQDLPGHRNLAEARALIDSLAGLLCGAAPNLGHHRAAPLWDGLRALQLAYRKAAPEPDEPGEGPGERFTGPVYE